MPPKKAPFLTKPYSGYLHREVPEDDRELTRVGPGTPMGEYLRRFWQPLLLSEQITDLPVPITRFDEELVAFRDGDGRVGIVESHCSHRGTSLEYGKVEQRGIRCCYHGWLYDIDGRILETPGEPETSTLKDRLCHGAYPAIEYGGLVFAYMGPPDETPEFPNFDIFSSPGYHLEPGVHLKPTDDGIIPNPKPCNWLQVMDNLLDPVHEEFLHATISGIQFVDKSGAPIKELAINGELGFVETPTGVITMDVRRVSPKTVWVRNIEFLWPNLGCLGAPPTLPYEWGPDEQEFHDLPTTLMWAVPVDDYNCVEIDFYLVPDGAKVPPERRFSLAQRANRGGREYDDMQRGPGDFEAMISQRPIAVHAMEHLGAEDRGVTMYRKGLRRRVRMLKNGESPPEIAVMAGKMVNTFGGDTLLRAPEAEDKAKDKKLLKKLGIDMAERYTRELPNHPDNGTGTN